MTLLFLGSAFAYSTNEPPVQAVIKSHEKALDLTRKLKSPPPQMALMLAMANKVAAGVSQSHQSGALSYYASFVEFYSLAYPAEAAFIKSDFLVQPGQEEAVARAQKAAQEAWLDFEPYFKRASSKTAAPWPMDGYETGGWRPTPPKFSQPLYPYWKYLSELTETNSEALLTSVRPLPFNSYDYLHEVREVHQWGGKNSKLRNLEQTTIALFWAGGSGTVTPPGMWVQVALKEIKSQNLDFKKATEVLKVLTQALSDASVVAWAAKFQYATCRPITAIEEVMKDRGWEPLLDTPPFPSWVSGHSTFSSAAAVVIDALLLKGRPLSVESEAVPQVVRTYKDAWSAALEAGQSRIFGGIHFSDDNYDGLELGKNIGCGLLKKHHLGSCE